MKQRVLLCLAFYAGTLLPVAVFTGGAGTLMITFISLVAASVLPTITLMLSNMTARGRSVQKVEALRDELGKGIELLLFLFGCSFAAVLCLFLLSAIAPYLDAGYGTLQAISRLLALAGLPTGTGPIKSGWIGMLFLAVAAAAQGICAFFTLLITMKAGTIAHIVRRSLAITGEMAIDDARRKISENAPTSTVMAESFKTNEGFGRRIPLAELRQPSEH